MISIHMTFFMIHICMIYSYDKHRIDSKSKGCMLFKATRTRISDLVYS